MPSSPGKSLLRSFTQNLRPLITPFSVDRYPKRVTRRMGKDRASKSQKVKPFIKVLNYNHMMPTRYTMELEGLKGTVGHETFKEPSQREEAKKNIKKALEDRYGTGKNRWFFTPLKF